MKLNKLGNNFKEDKMSENKIILCAAIHRQSKSNRISNKLSKHVEKGQSINSYWRDLSKSHSTMTLYFLIKKTPLTWPTLSQKSLKQFTIK